MAGVHFQSVSKVFGKDVVAVDHLNLEVRDGEFMVLVGPSGCGKTTALRMLAGLEETTSGDILIGEKRVNDVPPKDRDIAMVFQNYALYPHMSVEENIAFGLKLRELKGFLHQVTRFKETQQKRLDIEKRVRQTAEMLGIEELLHRLPKELSGGQRQRVALARAIVRKPNVYLMDEPLSNLDAKLRIQTRAEIIRLHQQLQTTTLYVTHDQTEAMTMGSRIAVMKNGVLQQLDTPENVYQKPQNLFVASFIGSPPMNLIRTTRQAEQLIAPGIEVPLTAEWQAKTAHLSEVMLGFRPEALTTERAADLGIVFQAQVQLIENLGPNLIAYLEVSGTPILASLRTSGGTTPGALRPGENLTIYLKPDDLTLFDPGTEEAIR
ncbi:MAG TPA: ABC transporter ATP-binding protein [Fimbriimonadaceae bacterium]|nr:ABC transporter ATP-binding protein [Fimbriimonadaceae bacterium]HRJ33009.1 ABC transporter ATP-binding protein [Fimbriimonadaceae bacterium]